jgi:Family of unknown function (DUF5317)
MLLVYAVALGLIAGLVSRGRLSALGSVHIRFWPVALVGLAFQLLLFSSPIAASVGRLGPSLYVLSTTLVLMALLFNLRQPGFWLITIGALLNFSAIIANNGFMPASLDAMAALTGGAGLPTADYTNSALASSTTVLPFLGDIFVLPHPLPLANVFSIGDLLIGLGGGWFVVRTMHRAVPADAPMTAARPAEANHA